MFDSIFFLSVCAVTIITVVVWPVMFMAHIVRAERSGFVWSLAALLIQHLLWLAIIVIAALALRFSGIVKLDDVEALKQSATSMEAALPVALPGLAFFILYTAVNAWVFQLTLLTSFMKGVAISLGSHIVRIILAALLALIAVLLS